MSLHLTATDYKRFYSAAWDYPVGCAKQNNENILELKDIYTNIMHKTMHLLVLILIIIGMTLKPVVYWLSASSVVDPSLFFSYIGFGRYRPLQTLEYSKKTLSFVKCLTQNSKYGP